MSSDFTGSGEPGQQNGLNGQGMNAGSASPKKSFTLSVDAPVFVPRFTMPQQPPAMQQPPPMQQLPQMQPMLPQQPMPQQPIYQEAMNSASIPSGPASADMQAVVGQFREAVVTLTTKGNVEEYMRPIIDRLRRGIVDMAILHQLVDVLYQQSVNEANFPYTGAHICKFLSNELRSHPVCHNFRDLFLTQCRSAYDNRDAMVANPTTFPIFANLAMLIGQLFLVLEDEENGYTQKVGFLRQAISSILMTLLAQPDDGKVKCAAQLLKLTGFEITKHSHLPGDFEQVYNIIRSLEKHPSLNRTSHCLINSVLSRLEYNWGVETS